MSIFVNNAVRYYGNVFAAKINNILGMFNIVILIS